MQKRRVLVIGSKGHSRAECFDWLQPFPNIEEYDSIIINMQSLTQENYDNIQNEIEKMRKSISTIIDTSREVFCVINNIMYPSPPLKRQDDPDEPLCKSINPDYVSPTSYDWLPVRIKLDSEKMGTNISLRNNRFKDYFDLVHEWKCEINFLRDTGHAAARGFWYGLHPIAVNKSEKIIAGSLSRINDRKKLLEGEEIGMIHLLPLPKEDSLFQAIERLIDIVVGAEVKVIVPWREQINLPNERDFKENIQKKLSEIGKIQEEISQLQEQLQRLESFRDLLTETGERLENIVQETLENLGITTKKTEKGFPADLLNKNIAVEITGIKGSVGADSNKVTQIGRFIKNYQKREKVVLIVNCYMDTPPKDRKGKMNFSPEMRKYLESCSVCYMTTQTLFDLWKKVILGEKEQKSVREKILNTIGEVSV